MDRLFFLDSDALSEHELFPDEALCTELLARLGLHEGMPFLLDSGGSPLRHANAWLRALPSRGCASRATWRGYGRDLNEWNRFLRAQGADLLNASRDHVITYHGERRLGTRGPARVLSPKSWNRAVHALDNFYDWTVEEGLLRRPPFSYRWARRLDSNHRHLRPVNQALERAGRPHATLKWLEYDLYKFFLDVGLSGLLPDGTDDPSFRGQQAPRNRAFGELLGSAGLRQAEAAHLLLCELPQVPERRVQYVELWLPAPICKGRKRRRTLVPPATLRTLHSYAQLERATVAESTRWSPRKALRIDELDVDGCRLNGRRRRWELVAPEDRERLVLPDGSSALIFLTREGHGLLSWNDVFRSATARCRTFRPDFPTVTPHTLRHTFAVHMLRWLQHHADLAAAHRNESFRFDKLHGALRCFQPLRTLQALLGHAHLTTTEVYLDGLNETRDFVNLIDELADVD